MPLAFWAAHVSPDLTLEMLDVALICFPATVIKRSDQKPAGKEGIGFSFHLQLTLRYGRKAKQKLKAAAQSRNHGGRLLTGPLPGLLS